MNLTNNKEICLHGYFLFPDQYNVNVSEKNEKKIFFKTFYLYNLIKVDKRITVPYLTKYEKARILGARALQLSMGAPALIQLNNESDVLDIAAKELKKRKIPIVLRRYLPKGTFEEWCLDELVIE